MCRARVVLLKSEGVLQLDKTEAEEARLLRESRQKCGCSCIGISTNATNVFCFLSSLPGFRIRIRLNTYPDPGFR
jgi:hypothetical protein